MQNSNFHSSITFQEMKGQVNNVEVRPGKYVVAVWIEGSTLLVTSRKSLKNEFSKSVSILSEKRL
jgi:hypothetical protein